MEFFTETLRTTISFWTTLKFPLTVLLVVPSSEMVVRHGVIETPVRHSVRTSTERFSLLVFEVFFYPRLLMCLDNGSIYLSSFSRIILLPRRIPRRKSTDIILGPRYFILSFFKTKVRLKSHLYFFLVLTS